MRLFEGTEFDVPPWCERCGERIDDCQCEPLPEPWLSPSEQRALVRVEKRKRGKRMTVIWGLSARESDLEALVTVLKDACGAGGTVKGDVIEIQGDQRERVSQKLGEIGYQVGG